MIKSLPLSLDAAEFPANHIVAYQLQGQSITWVNILARIAFWKSKLQGITHEKVAVYHSDGVEFLCIVLVLWRMGRIPLIPANNLESTVRSIELETDCFIGEFPQKEAVTTGQYSEQINANEGSEEKLPQQTALIMFTSGSTGEPAAIYKTFDQINVELEKLEEHWGDRLKHTITAGTVSHHHMYGLPFFLLWPLVSGRAFLSRNLTYLEQLISIRWLNITLISSPAHLEHIPATVNWKQLQKSIKTIFSAGALLSETAVIDCQRKMGVVVTEIYGSTETGAVAYRDQTINKQWKSLNGIQVKRINRKLAVNSPAAIKGDWFVTEDLCEIDSRNEFSLLGRADKIIKVGGRRVSITAIESRLNDHPWVKKAHVLLLEERKNRVGAVIQLTGEGNAKLVDQGKLATSRELTISLKEYIEKVAWPRYWRFVSRIPVNQQGKITTQALKRLFDNEMPPHLPKVLETSLDEESGKYVIQFEVPQDLRYLEGHFPGKPILPGVVQIGWAIHFFSAQFGNQGDFIRLEALKFKQVIQPGEKIDLSLLWDNKQNKLTFQYTSKDCIHASGRVFFTGAN